MPYILDHDSHGSEHLVPGIKIGNYPGRLTQSALLPGDVLVWYESQAGKIHDLIRETTQGPYTHTGIYIGDGESVDAGPQGVAYVPVADLIANFEVGDVMRYSGLNEDRRALIVAKAHSFVGYEYAWRDAIEMTFRRDYFWRKTWAENGNLEWTVRGAVGQRLIEHRLQNGPPHQAIYCSQMVIEAYEAGLSFPDDWVASGVLSPNDLLTKNIFQYQGFLSTNPAPDYHPLALNADIPRLSKRAWAGSWLRFARACLRPRK